MVFLPLDTPITFELSPDKDNSFDASYYLSACPEGGDFRRTWLGGNIPVLMLIFKHGTQGIAKILPPMNSKHSDTGKRPIEWWRGAKVTFSLVDGILTPFPHNRTSNPPGWYDEFTLGKTQPLLSEDVLGEMGLPLDFDFG